MSGVAQAATSPPASPDGGTSVPVSVSAGAASVAAGSGGARKPGVAAAPSAAAVMKVMPPDCVSVPMIVPVLVNPPVNSSVPLVTSTVPLLENAAAITLVPVPPVFSNSPALLIDEAPDAPMPLSPVMS